MDAGLESKIKRFDSVVSTNTTARELIARGATEGTVVVAESQTGGKGRNNRQWHSPKGGIYLSVILYPRDARRMTDLSLLAGTALAQGLKEILPKSSILSVKWPNDILINWRKVAGVLCEATTAMGAPAVIVGMGINNNVSGHELVPFQNNPFKATSISEEMKGNQFKNDEILEIVLKKFFTLYDLHQREGFKPIHYLWEKNCRMIGKKIELRETGWREAKPVPKDGSVPEAGVTTGTLLGIDEGGALVLANARGERHQYVTGEITCFWP